jgi:hypothetical protein
LPQPGKHYPQTKPFQLPVQTTHQLNLGAEDVPPVRPR